MVIDLFGLRFRFPAFAARLFPLDCYGNEHGTTPASSALLRAGLRPRCPFVRGHGNLPFKNSANRAQLPIHQ